MLLVRLMCFKAVSWYLSCQKGRLKPHLSFGLLVLHCKTQRKRRKAFPVYCWHASEACCVCPPGYVLGLGSNFGYCQPWIFTLEQIQDPKVVIISWGTECTEMKGHGFDFYVKHKQGVWLRTEIISFSFLQETGTVAFAFWCSGDTYLMHLISRWNVFY